MPDFDKQKAEDRLPKPSSNGGAPAPVTRRAAPPAVVEPRCKVCKSQYRHWIESMIAAGESQTAIAKRLENLPEPVPRRSIGRHVREDHMDLADATIRRIIEQEAELEGRNIEDGVNNLLTKHSMLDVLARKGYQDVIDGNVTVEPRDLIQIIRVMAEMESQSAIGAVEEARLQVQMMAEAIRRAFPDAEDQAKVKRELRYLKRNYEVENAEKLLESSTEIVEATVVDTE
jgi:hypothetical protein